MKNSVLANKAKRNTLLFYLMLVALLLLASTVIYLILRPATVLAPTPETPPAVLDATVMDTSKWKTYTDAEAGFSLKYPTALIFNGDSDSTSQLRLTVISEKLSDIPEDLPLRMGRTDALLEKAALEKGEYDNAVNLGSVNGAVSYTYSQFEVCSVLFQKEITFYQGDYRVRVLLFAPKEKIIAEMPNFFHTDPANCGSQMIWQLDKTDEFNSLLVAHKGTGTAQNWYDTFQAIVGTIQLTTPKISATPVINTTAMLYKNDTYGFELQYEKPYRVLTDADNLSGWPHGIALIYAGGQAYDIVIQSWATESAYKEEYKNRLSDVKVINHNGLFITVLDNTKEPGNQKIIDSIRVLP